MEKVYSVQVTEYVGKATVAKTRKEAAAKLGSSIEKTEYRGNIMWCCFFEEDVLDIHGVPFSNVYIAPNGAMFEEDGCSSSTDEDLSMCFFDEPCTYEWDGNNHVLIAWHHENNVEWIK